MSATPPSIFPLIYSQTPPGPLSNGCHWWELDGLPELSHPSPKDLYFLTTLFLTRCWHLTHVQRRVWKMQLTFCCSYQGETVPPEILCSDCCSVELDTSDTLCANRSVSSGQHYRCLLSCSYWSRFNFPFFVHFLKYLLSPRHVTGRT